MLSASLSPLPFAVTGEPLNQTTPRIYQVVQETGAGPRFLTSWDTLEAAMRDCRALNVCSGSPFKTVLWGSGTPCLRCSRKDREFKMDNALPSLVYSPGAVKDYPDALPVSAVYNHGAEVIFLPDGSPKATALAEFAASASPLVIKSAVFKPYARAVDTAKVLAKHMRSPTFVVARHGGRVVPVVRIQAPKTFGLADFDVTLNPIVNTVTPEEFQRLVTDSEQWASK